MAAASIFHFTQQTPMEAEEFLSTNGSYGCERSAAPAKPQRRTCRAFRTDSSITVGTGHLYRCLTLGVSLRDRGDATLAICGVLPGNLIEYIENQGHVVRRLPTQLAGRKGFVLFASPLVRDRDWRLDARNTLRL